MSQQPHWEDESAAHGGNAPTEHMIHSSVCGIAGGGRNINPVSCPVGEVVNFLASLVGKGRSYRTVNSYRPSISSVHCNVNGAPMGSHPLVSRAMKGAFHTRPLLPKYKRHET